MHLVKAWKSSQNLTKLRQIQSNHKKENPVTIVKGSNLPWIYSKGNALHTKNLIIFFTHVELIIFHWFLFWPIIDVIFFYMLLIICHINKYQIFYTLNFSYLKCKTLSILSMNMKQNPTNFHHILIQITLRNLFNKSVKEFPLH